MIFKAIRYLIYSPLELVLENKHIYNVDTHDSNINIYDNYEVIGIRSEYYDHEEYVVISLKPTKTSYYEDEDLLFSHLKEFDRVEMPSGTLKSKI